MARTFFSGLRILPSALPFGWARDSAIRADATLPLQAAQPEDDLHRVLVGREDSRLPSDSDSVSVRRQAGPLPSQFRVTWAETASQRPSRRAQTSV